MSPKNEAVLRWTQAAMEMLDLALEQKNAKRQQVFFAKALVYEAFAMQFRSSESG